VSQNSARRSASRSVAGLASGEATSAVLWFHLLKVCGATAASAYHFLMPPLGMLFAWIILGEHVEVRDLMGIVPVALGIYLVTRPAAASAS
jgi:drug/metabolite transporter (DMT)-like permease